MNKVTYISKTGHCKVGLTNEKNIYDFVAEMSKHEHDIEKVMCFSPAVEEDLEKKFPILFEKPISSEGETAKLDNNELLFELAKHFDLSRDEYESLIHDVNTLRADEWIEAFKNDGENIYVQEFMSRFV